MAAVMDAGGEAACGQRKTIHCIQQLIEIRGTASSADIVLQETKACVHREEVNQPKSSALIWHRCVHDQ